MSLHLLIHYIFILGAILGASFPNASSASQARRRSEDDSRPTDDEIDRAFTGIGPDQTVVTALLGDRDWLAISSFARYIQGKSLTEAFTPAIIMYMGLLYGQDPDAYDAFIEKLRLKIYKESAGTVWLLALDDILYENLCGTWASYEFKALKENPNVLKIMWVDRYNYVHRVKYWERGDPESDNPDSDKPPIQQRPRESTLEGNLLRAIGPVGVTGVAGAIGGTDALIGGTLSGTPIGVPGSTAPTIQRPEEVNQADPGTMTDVLPGIVGALPVEESPAFDDFGQQGISGRRSLNLHRRKVCPPAHAEKVFGPSPSESPDIAPIKLHVGSTVPPADLGSVTWTTVRVTQYWNPYSLQGILGQYRIDVSLLDSNGKVIGSVTGAQAPNDQPVPVHSSLPLPFYVTMGANLEDSLQLQYGGGRPWNSQDANHLCQQGQWGDDNKRVSECKFSVELETYAKNVLGP